MALLDFRGLVIVTQILTAICLFSIGKWIYRLTLHPLAKFPGPKRAAATSVYGAFWDVPLRTSYIKEFATWHDKYQSEVIRIAPNHLHIRSFDGYNEIFKMGSKFGRDPSFYQFPFSEGSFWTDPSVKDGLSQRSLYHQYFSRIAVQKLESAIQSQLSLLLTGINEMRKRQVPVDLSMAFRCFTGDTVGSYMFDQSFGFLASSDFQSPTLLQLEELLDMMPISWYSGKLFVWLVKLMAKLPRTWLGKNGTSATLRINDMITSRMQVLSQQPATDGSPNIFQVALNPATEKGQPKVTFDQLVADAMVFFTAGSESPANMLAYCIHNLLRNPTYLQSLQAELATAIPLSATVSATSPKPSTFPISWTDLERLPLLRAAVKETLRLAYGVPGKLPRVVPAGGALIAGHYIPEGTIVSSCSYVHHNDARHYPEPLQFRPERWFVNEDVTEEAGRFPNNGGVDPDKHFTAFSRGSRNCLGINLAYAEMYTGIAYLLRNYRLELFETREEDMEWHDSFVSAPFGHLKVKVVGLVTE